MLMPPSPFHLLDREAALRDDFHLETTYDYGDEDEWDDNEANWNGEEEEANEEEGLESKDESKAYLEFLNDEVRDLQRLAVCNDETSVYLFFY